MTKIVLSDNAAHDRLFAARRALGDEPAGSVHADTALVAARIALNGLADGLLVASMNARKEVVTKDDASPDPSVPRRPVTRR